MEQIQIAKFVKINEHLEMCMHFVDVQSSQRKLIQAGPSLNSFLYLNNRAGRMAFQIGQKRFAGVGVFFHFSGKKWSG